MKNRVIALLTMLSILLTALPVSAIADTPEPEAEIIEPMVSEVTGEIGVPEAPMVGMAPAAVSEDIPGVLAEEEAETIDAEDAVVDEADPIEAQGGLVEGVFALDASDLQLTVGDAVRLIPSASDGITWQSDDVQVARVSDEGEVTAIAPGETVIYARNAQGQAASCAVRVLGFLAEASMSGIHFNLSTLDIGLKETSDRLEVLTGADEAPVDPAMLTFTSSKPTIATVDENGRLLGKKRGKTVITAKAQDGSSAKCTVRVRKKPTKVTLTPNTVVIRTGETRTLETKLSPSTAAGALTWSSSNDSIVSVDARTGLMTGISDGTATITAKTYNGKTAKCKVTVEGAPTTLSFDEKTITIGVGQTVEVNAKTDIGTTVDIQYQSANKKVFTVKDNAITGVVKGTAKLIATTANGLKAECKIIVKAKPKSVKLSFKKLCLGVGETRQLYPTAGGCKLGFTYTSSKPACVKVSETGLLTALKTGTTKVTITSYNGKTFKLTVYVRKAPTSFSISPNRMELSVGDSAAPDFRIPTGSCATISFAVDDPTVAQINDDTGEVTAIAPGSTSITATTYNGLTDTLTVVVLPGAAAIELVPDSLELSVDDSSQLEVRITEGGKSVFTFESDDPSVATVTDEGLVTGKSVGTTVIHARAEDSEVFAEATVTVFGEPDSIRLSDTSITLEVNDTYAIDPIIPEHARTTFTYESLNSGIATVSDAGQVYGVSRGSTSIVVSTHNGKTATLKVAVTDAHYPDSVVLNGSVPTMRPGDTYVISYTLQPKGAESEMQWSSSDEDVATVDENGRIVAIGAGSATITAVSVKNAKCKLTIQVKVERGSELTLEIPKRITGTNEIKTNLAKIDAIRESAIQVIDALEDDRDITASDADKRRSMVNNIFKCYAFPWMTLSYQDYWKAANSEGGVKDFKPGNVYYGLPYTSGSGDQRHYNVDQALSENRYYDSGKGYYIMNQNNLLKGKYVGNDCSGLVDVAIWGTNSSHSDDRTTDIAKTSAYRTINDFKAMRPGDLICKSAAHVVMFLYYVDDSRTSFMMIENGGAEAGTNTVHCDIYPADYYISRGYKVRRLATLG